MISFKPWVGLGLAGLCLSAWAADPDAELQRLKAQLQTLQKTYQAQIEALQKRIERLEAQAREAPPPPQPKEQQRPNAFNPAVSLVLNGRYQTFRKDRGDASPAFRRPRKPATAIRASRWVNRS